MPTCAIPTGASEPLTRHATAQEKFDKLVAKSAATDPIDPHNPKFRSACACVTSLPPSPGFLDRVSFDHKVYCALPSFAADGSLLALSYCQQFVVLGH